jgi:hypothetical protein
MKKVYVSPILDVTEYEVEDIITTSGTVGGFDADNSGVGADKGNQTIVSQTSVVSLAGWYTE